MNVILKPVLIISYTTHHHRNAWPVLLVINTLIILIIDKLMDNIRFDGFGGPFLFAICLSFLSSILVSMFSPQKKDKEQSF